MAANVNLIPKDLSQAPELPVNEAKEGLHYDTCACCHSEVEPIFKNRQGEGGQEQHDWSLYSCPNDGRSWSRESQQGFQRNEAKGVNTKFKHAGLTRVITMPGMSHAYREGYDRIQNHGEPATEWASPYKR